jgi:hypothetical protein
MVRHCMPQKPTHQIAMMALRKLSSSMGGFGPRVRTWTPSALIAFSSAWTESTKASMSEKASQDAGLVLAETIIVPMFGVPGDCCVRTPILVPRNHRAPASTENPDNQVASALAAFCRQALIVYAQDAGKLRTIHLWRLPS